MPDFTPPPRRPAPDHLREDISRLLDAAPRRQFRWRTVVVPLAAASLLGATIFGISALGDRQTIAPSDTASPYPATATQTFDPAPPTASPTATYSAACSIRAPSSSRIARRYSTGMTFTNFGRKVAQSSNMACARAEPV